MLTELDQTIPRFVAEQTLTSAVFDFTFDYNVGLARRDAGGFSIRMENSNTIGKCSSALIMSSSNIVLRLLEPSCRSRLTKEKGSQVAC